MAILHITFDITW